MFFMALFDTSNDEKKQKKSDRRRERENSDLRFVLKSPEGRRFVWRYMEKGKAFQDPFCFENTNSTHYNLGRQSISRDLLNDVLEAKPEVYEQMVNERKAEDEDDKRQEELDRKQDGGLV